MGLHGRSRALPEANLKIFEGVKKGWESIKRTLKKTQQANTFCPQYLFQINCFSLKAVVTSLEHFSNPTKHNSVEPLPKETAVLAFTDSDPSQNTSKTFVSTSLQSQAAEPTPL